MDELILKYRRKLDELLAAPKLSFGSTLRRALPDDAGIYRIFRRQSDWRSSVYVGQSSSLRRRLCDDHLAGNRSSSTLKRKLINAGLFSNEASVQRFLTSDCVVQTLLVPDKVERAFIEHFAIAMLRPEHND